MLKKIIFAFVGVLILGVAFYFLFFNEEKKEIVITNFQECVDAGYPIMETYPVQCMTEEGDIFFEEGEDWEENEYYGSSTEYPCEERGDCVEAGCNSEICTGIDEGGMASVCLFPEQPLPRDLGYTCGCFENKCQWGKD